MDAKDNALGAIGREVAEVVFAEPVSEASVATIAEAVPGYVVAVDDNKYEVREEVPPHKNGKLKSVIECMLFVSTEPLTAKQLAETLEMEEAGVEEALAGFQENLNEGSGLQLAQLAGGWLLCTRPEYADYCAALLVEVE